MKKETKKETKTIEIRLTPKMAILLTTGWFSFAVNAWYTPWIPLEALGAEVVMARVEGGERLGGMVPWAS